MTNGIELKFFSDRNKVRISVLGVPDVPGIAAKLFTELSNENINTGMIIQNISAQGQTDISFLIAKEDLKKTTFVSEKILTPIRAKGLTIGENIVKITVFFKTGTESESCKNAAKIFAALSQKKINIQMILASETEISVVVDLISADDALPLIRNALEMEKK